jgi:hypothetical protein
MSSKQVSMDHDPATAATNTIRFDHEPNHHNENNIAITIHPALLLEHG